MNIIMMKLGSYFCMVKESVQFEKFHLDKPDFFSGNRMSEIRHKDHVCL